MGADLLIGFGFFLFGISIGGGVLGDTLGEVLLKNSGAFSLKFVGP